MIKTPLSTMIGGAFWTPGATILGGTSNTLNQIIKSLFANNAQGFVYDPNDLTTMFQDAAGTVPVTGTGQPVGLIKDKSGRGNHAYQTTAASRPILQQTPILGSDITVNGDFNSGLDDDWLHTSGGWSANGGVVTSSGTINGLSFLTNLNSLAVGDTAKIVIKIANKGTKGSLGVAFGDGATDHKKWTVSEMGSLTELSWAAVLTNNNRIYITTRDGWDGSIDKVEIRKVTGYRTDQNYLAFDGTDDFLQTSNIDFTATDKVSLFTGLRKLRDSPAESILESGVLPYDGVGTFWLTTNALAPGDVWLAIAQAWNARTGFSKITPVANNFIVSAKLDFAGSVATDEVKPRLNGSTSGFTRGLGEHAGAGNFGNHPMYIGSRAGTSLQFNGHLYSLIGVGRLTTDDETVALEKLIAKYTGVTLSV